MAEERARRDWATAAAIVCKIHEGFCGILGGDPIGPADVHPILAEAGRGVPEEEKMTMGELGAMIGHSLG